MTDIDPDSVSGREKLDALLSAARYRPKFTALLVVLGLAVAVLEGVGLTFILPIVEIIQVDDPVAEADGLMLMFVRVYQTFGIPFTLESAILGVAFVMTLRYTGSFLYGWFRRILRFTYQRDPNQTDYWAMLLALDKNGDLEGAKSGATPEFKTFGPGRS
jgi:subfamily B ATP-binding cassette protein MsbA